MKETLIFDVLQDESFTGDPVVSSLWALVMVTSYFVAAAAYAAKFFPQTWLGRVGRKLLDNIWKQRQLKGRYVGMVAFALAVFMSAGMIAASVQYHTDRQIISSGRYYLVTGLLRDDRIARIRRGRGADETDRLTVGNLSFAITCPLLRSHGALGEPGGCLSLMAGQDFVRVAFTLVGGDKAQPRVLRLWRSAWPGE